MTQRRMSDKHWASVCARIRGALMVNDHALAWALADRILYAGRALPADVRAWLPERD